jgi:hypothetical protein
MRPNSLIKSMQEAAQQDRQPEGPADSAMTSDTTTRH